MLCEENEYQKQTSIVKAAGAGTTEAEAAGAGAAKAGTTEAKADMRE